MSRHDHLYLLDLTASYHQREKYFRSFQTTVVCFKTYFNKPHIWYFLAESNIHPQVFEAPCQNTPHRENTVYHRTPHWGPDLAETSHAFKHQLCFSAAPAQRWSQDGLRHRRTWELTFLSSNHSQLRNVCSQTAIKCFTKARYLAANTVGVVRLTKQKSSQWSPHVTVK